MALRSDRDVNRPTGRRLRDAIVRWLSVLATSIRNFVLHQCGTYAGSVAFSWLLSLNRAHGVQHGLSF